MYRMIRTVDRRDLLLRLLPTGTVALVAAELFFRFHSFTLECLVFLGVWYALDGAVEALLRLRE